MVTDDFTGYAFKARNLTRLSIIKWDVKLIDLVSDEMSLTISIWVTAYNVVNLTPSKSEASDTFLGLNHH